MSFRSKFQWTVISDDFINNYMADANGTYVKIYIYWEMKSQKGDTSIDLKKTAEALKLSIEDVEMARDYWTKKGLFNADSDEAVFESVENFANVEFEEDSSEKDFISDSNLDKNVDFLLEANKIPEFKKMFDSVDLLLQRETSPNEKSKLLDFITDFGMNPDVVLEAVKASLDSGKKNFAYIEGIVKNWHNAGVTSIESLNEYLSENQKEDERYGEIRNFLGRSGSLTGPEKSIADKWFNEFGYDMTIVGEGMKRLTQTNNPNINYVDRIITSWYEKGIKTVQDIEIKDKKPKKASKQGKFDDFEQRDNEDIDAEYYNEIKKRRMMEEDDE